jgi:hypothetical protein
MNELHLRLTDEELDFFVVHLIRDIMALYNAIEENAEKGGRRK